MKKRLGVVGAGVLGAALALGGGLGVPVQASGQGQTQNVRQDKTLPPEEVKEVQVVKNRQTGAIRMRRGWGISPKQYGQYLQSRGKQNWSGRVKRHRVQVYPVVA